MNVFHLLTNIRKKIDSLFKKYDGFALKLIAAKSPAYFAGFLIVFLLGLFEINLYTVNQNIKLVLNSSPVAVPSPALYPKLISDLPAGRQVLGLSTQNQISLPNISAEGALVMDDESKTIIYGKNPNLRFSMASTTKIMTALTALSYFKDDDILTVKSKASGSLVGFTVGEQVSFSNLLYGMLLPSGNDAALTIAQNYPGGLTAFVAKMNENALRYHLSNTNFADPAGLLDTEDYTTPIDLARLASIAIKNEKIAQIVSTKEKIITDISGKHTYKLVNLNKLLGEDGVNGIKTGFTDEALGVLVTSKIEQGHLLIIVVMKSEDRFADTQELLKLISGNIKYYSIQTIHSELQGQKL